MSKFYDLKQVADTLNISVKALRIRVSKGKMPNTDKREGTNLFWLEETLVKARILTEPARNAQPTGRAAASKFDVDDLVKTINPVNPFSVYSSVEDNQMIGRLNRSGSDVEVYQFPVE